MCTDKKKLGKQQNQPQSVYKGMPTSPEPLPLPIALFSAQAICDRCRWAGCRQAETWDNLQIKFVSPHSHIISHIITSHHIASHHSSQLWTTLVLHDPHQANSAPRGCPKNPVWNVSSKAASPPHKTGRRPMGAAGCSWKNGSKIAQDLAQYGKGMRRKQKVSNAFVEQLDQWCWHYASLRG